VCVGVIDRKPIVLRNVSTQQGAFREAYRQGRRATGGGGTVDKPKRAKPTNAVEALAGLQIVSKGWKRIPMLVLAPDYSPWTLDRSSLPRIQNSKSARQVSLNTDSL